MGKQEKSSSSSPEMADTKHPIDEYKAEDDELGQMTEIEYTPEEDRRVLRKLDLICIPMMGLCYMMQYMDKLALSQATLFNIREDLGLQGSNYSWTSAIFYFGYLAWSWPSSYLMVRLPIGKYISTTVLVWGAVLMCHAATKNYGGLLAARFFLGVGEASIAPGFALITGFLYKREEQPARQAAWFFGNSVANVIGGVIAYGIGTAEGVAVNSWQLLFLALGAITAGMFFWLIFLLPDSPQKAVFLTKRERGILLRRTVENKSIVTTGDFKFHQAWLALKDPQTWFLVLYTFCVNLWNGGTTSFSAIIINGFGFGRLESLLLQMPMGAAQCLFLIISAAIATYVPRTRVILMIFNTAVSMVGAILVWQLDADNQRGRLTGLALAAVFGANIPLAMSLISANVAGFTKRSVTSVLTFVAYCVGNIVGPQLFFESEEPNYPTGMKGAISGLALGCFFLFCLLFYYLWENKRRDRKYGPAVPLTEEEERAQGLAHKTDLEIENFRYLI